VPEVQERTDGPPAEVAVENARRKASAVVAAAPAGAAVLGVDTVVSLGSRLYGKPSSLEEARATLLALSGREHAVTSGLCLIDSSRVRVAEACTLVRFREVSPLLEWYLASGEWRERAGGYAIQGRGAALVAAIDGDYLNVVGLPVAALLDLAPELLGGR
jgi:septum formation protein